MLLFWVLTQKQSRNSRETSYFFQLNTETFYFTLYLYVCKLIRNKSTPCKFFDVRWLPNQLLQILKIVILRFFWNPNIHVSLLDQYDPRSAKRREENLCVASFWTVPNLRAAKIMIARDLTKKQRKGFLLVVSLI